MKRKQLLQQNDKTIDRVVKIQGTAFDRKRKVTPKLVKQMSKMLHKNKSIAEIAKYFNLSYATVRYNIDPEWRKAQIAAQRGKHTGNTYITTKDRVEYKRSLIKSRAVSRVLLSK